MCPAQPFRRFTLLFLAFLAYCSAAAAQSPVDPGNLPGRTMFYLCWHGTPSGEVRKANSLFALWDDPELAATRDSLIQSLLTNATNPKNKLPMDREELGQSATLLDNPFVIGYMREPESHAAAKTPATAKTTPPPAWHGVFFIYDRSGKEELLSKTVTHLRSAEKDIPKLSELTVAGVSSLKIERTSGTTYWAEFGKYAVSANELSVFEEILNIVNGKIGASKLSQAASYQEARPLLDGGIMEFFLRVPTADEIVSSSPASSTAQIKLLLSALKLDSVHCVAGRISLQGTKSRLTGAVLGDTSPGGLFDIWADGQANPVSMGYLSPDTVYYGESQFNLLGIYNTMKRAFTSSTSGQASSVNPLEQMAATRLGMPLPDALGLLTGEFAWIQTSPTLDDTQKVYLLGIRNKPDALKLTRSLMGDQITSERAEGDATYMKISLRGGQSSAGLAQWNFYYLAMTPNLLFGATKSDVLHKYVGQAPSTPDSTQLKSLLAARAQFPEKLNGFSYFDFQKLDWPGLRAKWIADANKAVQTAKSTDAANTDKKVADWLSQVNPEVFSRHLHSVSGASWKDAKGVHFDEWLD